MRRIAQHSGIVRACAMAMTLLLGQPALAQAARERTAPQRDEMPSTMMEMMRDCQNHMRSATQEAQKARTALADARRSGDAARIRKAMTDAEKLLQGLTDQMGACMSMMGSMGGGGGPQGMMEHPMRDMDEMHRRHLEMHQRMRSQGGDREDRKSPAR